jgi:general stress protein CsbA
MHNLWVVAVDVINTNVGLLLAIASKSGDNGYCSMVEIVEVFISSQRLDYTHCR